MDKFQLVALLTETVLLLLLMFMQHIHVSPAKVHDWICTDDEYSRLLISANDTNSELIVCATQISCLFCLRFDYHTTGWPKINVPKFA